MSEASIIVENLSKRFRIGSRQPYHRASEILANTTKSLGVSIKNALLPGASEDSQNAAPPGSVSEKPKVSVSDEYWALKDVSFEVPTGQVVGVIGRNGAGKSTLLKILSRITEPTEGRFGVRGKVGSLLEVGTGFHPELTGRENVFLSGTILGMARQDVKQQFDAIAEFAGVQEFLDTPVKRYSSGMKVRLGFAVAAHLQPEILIVDEVLAVGDMSFQRKCLGKMQSVADSGRTVIFVSHNMEAISRLCDRCVWLHEGKLVETGETSSVIERYVLSNSQHGADRSFLEDESLRVQCTALRILNEQGEVASELSSDHRFSIEIEYSVRKTTPQLYFVFLINSEIGVTAIHSDCRDQDATKFDEIRPGHYRFVIDIPERTLSPGMYLITAIASDGHTQFDPHHDACAFTINDYSTTRGNKRKGVLGFSFRGK